MPFNHLILCCPLLPLPSVFLSITVFSGESALHIRWPKYRNFSFSISPSMNIQGWFLIGLTGLISLLSKGLSEVFSGTTVWKDFFGAQPSLWSNSHIHTWLLEKPFVSGVMSLLFNKLSRFVIGFLPRSKHFLISWIQSPSAVILSPRKENLSLTVSTFPQLFAMKWWD